MDIKNKVLLEVVNITDKDPAAPKVETLFRASVPEITYESFDAWNRVSFSAKPLCDTLTRAA